MSHGDNDGIGVETTFWNAGSLCLTAIIIICNLKLFFIQNRWHWSMALIVFASVLVWWLSALVFAGSDVLMKYSTTSFWEYYDTFYVLNANSSFWGALFLIVMAVLAKDIYVCALDRIYNFKNFHIIQEIEVREGVAINEAMRAANMHQSVHTDADVR